MGLLIYSQQNWLAASVTVGKKVLFAVCTGLHIVHTTSSSWCCSDLKFECDSTNILESSIMITISHVFGVQGEIIIHPIWITYCTSTTSSPYQEWLKSISPWISWFQLVKDGIAWNDILWLDSESTSIHSPCRATSSHLTNCSRTQLLFQHSVLFLHAPSLLLW